MQAGRLTLSKIRALKPKTKRFMVSDGAGLYLEIHPSGVKSWRVRYRKDGRPAKTNLGHWPALSLDEARRKLAQMKPSLFSGIPGTPVRVFGARYMHEVVERTRKNPSDVLRYLDRNVYPVIGDIAIDEVTVADLRGLIFAKREEGRFRAALAVRDILKRMFDYAVVCGVLSANPVLSIPRKLIATEHSRTRALCPDEVGRFVCRIETMRLKLHIGAALRLLLMTLMRKSELMLARWEHIDLNEREWIIPVEHAKTGTPHIVYLSTQAVAILRSLAAIAPGGQPNPRHMVFPQQWSQTQPMSESTLNGALERISEGMEHFTVHDLRRTAATLLSEAEYLPDVIEKALNHTIKGVRGIYNKAQYKEQRRTMLQDWSDMVDDFALKHKREASVTINGECGSSHDFIHHG